MLAERVAPGILLLDQVKQVMLLINVVLEQVNVDFQIRLLLARNFPVPQTAVHLDFAVFLFHAVLSCAEDR